MKKLLLLAVLLACGGTAPKYPTDGTALPGAEGTYALRTIDGQPVPWFYSGDSLAVRSGSIQLSADQRYLDILTYDYVAAGAKVTVTDTLRGEYRITDSAIQLREDGGATATGGFDGQAITFVYNQVVVYRK